jgi:hypothetical protein
MPLLMFYGSGRPIKYRLLEYLPNLFGRVSICLDYYHRNIVVLLGGSLERAHGV